MTSLNNLPFRKEYPVFSYNSYNIEKSGSLIKITFDFSIDGLCDFHPTVSIETSGLDVINDCNSDTAREIIFNMGMVEAVSYFKPVCPEKIIVRCGGLSENDKNWWKHLWYNGLGEFFHINSIEARESDFIEIECAERTFKKDNSFALSDKNIIPVGGGKDSCVTAKLVEEFKNNNLFFTVNDQKARTDCINAAGYGDKSTLKTYRTIDKNLLELNKKGFLNGHTPFSAIVAFQSLLCAYLTGAEYIILSNESSANEGNTGEGGVNHQYSKSFEFENDFSNYVSENITDNIKYFSLLRPFNELQIAKMFSKHREFHEIFRSCNRGSKQNIWCGNCPKCLFVFGMLSPFIKRDKLIEIFGCDMLDKEELLPDFKGLTALTPLKPFECVGTAEEYNLALAKTVLNFKKDGEELSYLLKTFDSNFDCEKIVSESCLLSEFNKENLVPEKFENAVMEMYEYVKNN